MISQTAEDASAVNLFRIGRSVTPGYSPRLPIDEILDSECRAQIRGRHLILWVRHTRHEDSMRMKASDEYEICLLCDCDAPGLRADFEDLGIGESSQFRGHPQR